MEKRPDISSGKSPESLLSDVGVLSRPDFLLMKQMKKEGSCFFYHKNPEQLDKYWRKCDIDTAHSSF